MVVHVPASSLMLARGFAQKLDGFTGIYHKCPTYLLVWAQKIGNNWKYFLSFTVDLCCPQDITLEQKLFYVSRMVKGSCKLGIPSPVLSAVNRSSVLLLGCDSVSTQKWLHLSLFSTVLQKMACHAALPIPFNQTTNFGSLQCHPYPNPEITTSQWQQNYRRAALKSHQTHLLLEHTATSTARCLQS